MRALALILMIAIASPAEAAAGAVSSIYSDYVFRGFSLSRGRPVAIVDLSYDARGGLYGAVSGSVVATRYEGLRPLGLVLNAGYAKPLAHGLTVDFGAVHSAYSRYSAVVAGRSYTEVYAGISGSHVGARLAVSPNYFGSAKGTLRAEVNGRVDLVHDLTLAGEAGALVPLGSGAYGPTSRASYDARVSLSRRMGPVSLHLAVTGRTGNGHPYYAGAHRRMALILGLSTAL